MSEAYARVIGLIDSEIDRGSPWQRKAVSVDPGSVHCGVAVWVQGYDDLWRCHWAIEMTPDECVDFVREVIRHEFVDSVVVEGFWLKPGLGALRQAGSEMGTVEVIGTLRNLCRWNGIRYEKVANGQDAIITRLNAAGYEWSAHGHGGHAKDAEAAGVRGLGLKVRQLAVVAGKRNEEKS